MHKYCFNLHEKWFSDPSYSISTWERYLASAVCLRPIEALFLSGKNLRNMSTVHPTWTNAVQTNSLVVSREARNRGNKKSRLPCVSMYIYVCVNELFLVISVPTISFFIFIAKIDSVGCSTLRDQMFCWLYKTLRWDFLCYTKSCADMNEKFS